MFDPLRFGYPLNPEFDRQRLQNLVSHFCSAVSREQDKSLATRLRNELLERQSPSIERATFQRLAKWCKTDGIYQDGMEVARQISLLLFGQVIDRNRIGV